MKTTKEKRKQLKENENTGTKQKKAQITESVFLAALFLHFSFFFSVTRVELESVLLTVHSNYIFLTIINIG